MNSTGDENKSLQAENAQLRAEIVRLRVTNAMHYNYIANLHETARVGTLRLDENSCLEWISNCPLIFDKMEMKRPIVELIKSESAKIYFDGIMRLRTALPVLAAGAMNQPWSCVFQSDSGAGLSDWVSIAPGCWSFEGGRARSTDAVLREGEAYLVSPRELIGADDDFRIEYSVKADSDPRDLSLVVGAVIEPADAGSARVRPERDGYCFAFGGIGNQRTMIQRSFRDITGRADAPIVRGREHHCVVERAGGVVRFSIDGSEILSTLDLLPLMGKGHGGVGLYVCNLDHEFHDLSVSVRPTCIPKETRDMISEFRKIIIEVPEEAARFLEVHYLGGLEFMFKDVTETVLQRESVEAQRRETEKMQAVLNLANAASHELNQPLAVLTSYLGMISKYPARHNATPIVSEELKALNDSTARMTKIVKQFRSIQEYQTKRYAGGKDIMDLDASSRQEQV